MRSNSKAAGGMKVGVILSGILLFCCSICDLREKKIPMLPVLIFGVVGIFLLLGQVREEVIQRIAGIFIGVGLLLVGKLTHESIGYGDAYLMGAVGCLMGAGEGIRILMIGFFLSMLYSAFLLIGKKRGRKATIPFVPFLFLGFCGIAIERLIESKIV